jgi:HYR domain-containing protein
VTLRRSMSYVWVAGVLVAIVAVCSAALTGTAGLGGTASASPHQSVGTLKVVSTFRSQYKFDDAYCPPGSEALTGCVRFVGTAAVPGLGQATSTYLKILPPNDPDCPVVQFNEATIEIAGKGTLRVARQGRSCGPTAPASVGPLNYAVIGGSGMYAGASGTLVFASSVGRIDLTCGCGKSTDTWTGTLLVPGVEFDITPPTIEGARSRTVRAPRSMKRVRVRYLVRANDNVDGPLPATCVPPSGSWFKLGRTTVACEAVDSNGNTGKARFTVTVRRS